MSVGLVFVLGLLLWTGSTGSRTPVFIQTKHDLLLDVREGVHVGDGDTFYWKLNNSDNIVRFINTVTISENFKGRVEFFRHNLSMILKHVQLNDSGLYTAVVSGDNDKIYTEYDVTVRDPVSPVNLTVDSVSNSSESCNFTVSCRTDDFKINHSFTCNNQICNNKEGYTETTPSAASLHLYLTEISIICNHSNQVSWGNDMTDLKQICPRNDANETAAAVGGGVALPSLGGVIGVILPCFAAVWLYRRIKHQRKESTVYEIPQVTSVSESVPRPRNPSVDSPTSTYSLVGPHTTPASPVIPESQYATVGKKHNES